MFYISGNLTEESMKTVVNYLLHKQILKFYQDSNRRLDPDPDSDSGSGSSKWILAVLKPSKVNIYCKLNCMWDNACACSIFEKSCRKHFFKCFGSKKVLINADQDPGMFHNADPDSGFFETLYCKIFWNNIWVFYYLEF